MRIVCIKGFSAGYETPTEVAFEAQVNAGDRGTISYVDYDVVRFVGVNKEYPAMQVQLLRSDFLTYWRKALPHEGY